MAESDWVDDPHNESDWVDDHPHDPKYNAAQSFAMHGLNQATGGFSDELQGLGEAAGRVVGVEGAGGPMKDMRFAESGPVHDWETLKDAYHRARDHERAALKQQSEEHSVASGAGSVVGAVTSPINKLAKGMSLAKGGAMLGGINALGSSDKEDLPGMATDTALGAGAGALGGKLIEKASPYLSSAQQKAAQYLKDKAENAAVSATGATGKQASEFAPGAGRELLDRGIVKFGDSQAKIAQRAGDAVTAANADIDSALTALQEKGVKVDANHVYEAVSSKINELKSDPSQADVVRNLEGELENLIKATDAKGATDFGIKEAEQIKRGYGRKAGNWADPEKGQAGKEMYQNFRGAVEDSARAADPATAKIFEEGKKSYGLLAPIQEAAERRAATTAQSPPGGLLDLGAMAGGMAKGGPLGAIAAPIARRVIAPRVSSSVAATSDKVSKFLLNSPSIQQLAQKSPQAFSSLVANFGRRVGGGAEDAISRVAGPDQQPIDDEKAQQSFVDGN